MRVLYLTYNGLTEPLGRRQILPYLLGLGVRDWRFTVVSFEKQETETTEARAEVEALLAPTQARWIRLRYHYRPLLPAKVSDLLRGLLHGAACAPGVDLIHARATLPAVWARTIAGPLRRPWIFDVRGLLAEEYADGGHWRRGGSLFRMTDGLERRLIRGADGLVFLTETIRQELAALGRLSPRTPVSIIPCSVDLQAFRPSNSARKQVRQELGLGAEPLLVYAGSLGSWYRMGEMMEFFRIAREEILGLRFLVLSPQGERAQEEARRANLATAVLVRSVVPSEVPAYLAAADAGICFLADCWSKRASSPTKYGEYLASGLPVVTDAWTGDSGQFRSEAVWIAVGGFNRAEYVKGANRLRTLLEAAEVTRTAARNLADRGFGLESALDRYDDLYRRTIAGRGGRARVRS